MSVPESSADISNFWSVVFYKTQNYFLKRTKKKIFSFICIISRTKESDIQPSRKAMMASYRVSEWSRRLQNDWSFTYNFQR